MVWQEFVRLCANHHHHKKHPGPFVTLALKGYHLDGADLVHALRPRRNQYATIAPLSAHPVVTCALQLPLLSLGRWLDARPRKLPRQRDFPQALQLPWRGSPVAFAPGAGRRGVERGSHVLMEPGSQPVARQTTRPPAPAAGPRRDDPIRAARRAPPAASENSVVSAMSIMYVRCASGLGHTLQGSDLRISNVTSRYRYIVTGQRHRGSSRPQIAER
jgi:hypothetical protein